MSKPLVYCILLCEMFGLELQSLGQVHNDTSQVTKFSIYKFHLNYKPQDGYGIILGFLGSQKTEDGNNLTRNVYKFGIAKTSHDYAEDGIMYDTKSISLEINQIENKTIYGFVGGLDEKVMFFDLGLYLNYMTDFSNNRALSIRPRFALSFFYLFNLDATIEYEIFPVKPNFEIVDHWLLGLQYTIDFLKRN